MCTRLEQDAAGAQLVEVHAKVGHGERLATLGIGSGPGRRVGLGIHTPVLYYEQHAWCLIPWYLPPWYLLPCYLLPWYLLPWYLLPWYLLPCYLRVVYLLGLLIDTLVRVRVWVRVRVRVWVRVR